MAILEDLIGQTGKAITKPVKVSVGLAMPSSKVGIKAIIILKRGEEQVASYQ